MPFPSVFNRKLTGHVVITETTNHVIFVSQTYSIDTDDLTSDNELIAYTVSIATSSREYTNTTEQPSNPFWSEFSTSITTAKYVASTPEPIERVMMEPSQHKSELAAEENRSFVFTAGSGQSAPISKDEEYVKSNLKPAHERDTVSTPRPTTPRPTIKTPVPAYEEFQAMLQADRDEMSEVKRVTRVRQNLDAMARRERQEAGMQLLHASGTQQYSSPAAPMAHTNQVRNPVANPKVGSRVQTHQVRPAVANANIGSRVQNFEPPPRSAMQQNYSHNGGYGESISVTEEFHAALLSMRNNHNGYGREYDELYSTDALQGFEQLLNMQNIEAHSAFVRMINEHYVTRRLTSSDMRCTAEEIFDDILKPISDQAPSIPCRDPNDELTSRMNRINARLYRNTTNWQTAVHMTRTLNDATDQALSNASSNNINSQVSSFEAGVAAGYATSRHIIPCRATLTAQVSQGYSGPHYQQQQQQQQGPPLGQSHYEPQGQPHGQPLGHRRGQHMIQPLVQRPIAQPRRRVVPDEVIVEKGGGIELSEQELASLQQHIANSNGSQNSASKKGSKKGKGKGKKR